MDGLIQIALKQFKYKYQTLPLAFFLELNIVPRTLDFDNQLHHPLETWEKEEEYEEDTYRNGIDRRYGPRCLQPG